jgi:transcriptional regulator with GAF, ATPase, and Fis domain
MGSLKSMVEELERKEILRTLEEAGWVKARAARALGLTERMLSYRIKKYGLQITKEVVIKR